MMHGIGPKSRRKLKHNYDTETASTSGGNNSNVSATTTGDQKNSKKAHKDNESQGPSAPTSNANKTRQKKKKKKLAAGGNISQGTSTVAYPQLGSTTALSPSGRILTPTFATTGVANRQQIESIKNKQRKQIQANMKTGKTSGKKIARVTILNRGANLNVSTANVKPKKKTARVKIATPSGPRSKSTTKSKTKSSSATSRRSESSQPKRSRKRANVDEDDTIADDALTRLLAEEEQSKDTDIDIRTGNRNARDEDEDDDENDVDDNFVEDEDEYEDFDSNINLKMPKTETNIVQNNEINNVDFNAYILGNPSGTHAVAPIMIVPIESLQLPDLAHANKIDFKSHTSFDPRSHLPAAPNSHIISNVDEPVKNSQHLWQLKNCPGDDNFVQSLGLNTLQSKSEKPKPAIGTVWETITVEQQKLLQSLPPVLSNLIVNFWSLARF